MKTKDLFQIKQDMVLARRKNIIKNYKEHSLPVFLRLLRDCYDVSREEMAVETGLPATRIYHLERGNFKRELQPHEIDVLSDYFGLPLHILRDKSALFVKFVRYATGKS